MGWTKDAALAFATNLATAPASAQEPKVSWQDRLKHPAAGGCGSSRT